MLLFLEDLKFIIFFKFVMVFFNIVKMCFFNLDFLKYWYLVEIFLMFFRWRGKGVNWVYVYKVIIIKCLLNILIIEIEINCIFYVYGGRCMFGFFNVVW